VSPEAAIAAKLGEGWGSPPAFVEEDVSDHLAAGPDGLYRYRYCQSAVVSLHGELATPPPRPARVPTLLVHAPAFGLVRDDQVEALRATLGPLLEEREVAGGHMVIWDAYEATADALDRFLAATSSGTPLSHP
ncbi:MAG: lipase, partial [Gaiellaceae bacterium]|nr:lipase [Gaiellaceae bacterium]